MRQFAASGFRLWNLSTEAKLIYSCFCGLSILAMLSSLLLYEDLVGPSLAGPSGSSLRRVKAYYSSEAAPSEKTAPAAAPAAPTATAAPEAGPAIALPTDDPTVTSAPAVSTPAAAEHGTTLTITMPYRKLLEVTHFHLFTVPVFLLILTHLFLLTAMGSRGKLFWIGLGWGTGTLHMAVPWLIRGFGGALGWLFPVSGFLFFASSLMLTVYPMLVMWKKPVRKRSDGGRAPAATADGGAAQGSESDEADE